MYPGGKKSAFYVTTVKSGGRFWLGRMRYTGDDGDIVGLTKLHLFLRRLHKRRSYFRDTVRCVVRQLAAEFPIYHFDFVSFLSRTSNFQR